MPDTSYKTGVNVWDYCPDMKGVNNPRFTLLTNQDLVRHYANVGYRYQGEILCGQAALQLYTYGRVGIAVVIPWDKDSPIQLTEIHYRVRNEAQFLQSYTRFLDQS